MIFLRWIALLALAFWVGGLAVLGLITAPVLFAVLETHAPGSGRELAGAVFGAAFTRFEYGALGAGAVLLGSIGVRAALGPRPRHFGVRMWIAAFMLAATAATTFWIAPRIAHLSAAISGPVASLADADPRRKAFGLWHGASTGLLLGTLLAGVALLWAEAHDEGGG
jgi:hypothetical protein